MDPIPDPALVVLLGPSGSGKTTWAQENFRLEEIVSSDRLRAIVGTGERDLDASAEAFAILDQVVEARLRRRLLTVVDTLGFDDERRQRHLALAREVGLPAILVVFEAPDDVVRQRNRQRSVPVPASVLTSQIRRFRQLRGRLADEGWDLRTPGSEISIRPAHLDVLYTVESHEKQVGVKNVDLDVLDNQGGPRAASTAPKTTDKLTSENEPKTKKALRLVLHLARFAGSGDLRTHLLSMAEAAENAGFDGISVMDHLVQIPQVGREWEDFPEAFTALGFLAGRTTNLTLGPLVTNVGLRNPALLAKMVATIDVLSGGRTFCGLGAGWFEAEQAAYGYEFEPPGQRLERLEDALRILPLMWGPGKANYQGKTQSVVDAISYPRPVGRIPILVGGRGRRTITLAATYADGLNLVGARHLPQQIELFRKAALDASRDPDSLEVSVLDTPLLGTDRGEVAALVEANRGRIGANVFAANHSAGTVSDHAERFRSLANTGVGAVFISPVGLNSPEGVVAWKPVVEEFG